MVKGIFCKVTSNVIIGSLGPLRNIHVVVQISSSLSEADVLDDWRYLVLAWPIQFVYYNGASFHDHEVQARYNSRVVALATGPCMKKSWPYNSSARNPPFLGSMKAIALLQ